MGKFDKRKEKEKENINWRLAPEERRWEREARMKHTTKTPELTFKKNKAMKFPFTIH
jgi:hypothetical protein